MPGRQLRFPPLLFHGERVPGPRQGDLDLLLPVARLQGQEVGSSLREIRFSPGDCHLERVRIQPEQNLAGRDALILSDQHFLNRARHPGADRRLACLDVCVVGADIAAAVEVDDQDHQHRDQRHDDQKDQPAQCTLPRDGRNDGERLVETR